MSFIVWTVNTRRKYISWFPSSWTPSLGQDPGRHQSPHFSSFSLQPSVKTNSNTRHVTESLDSILTNTHIHGAAEQRAQVSGVRSPVMLTGIITWLVLWSNSGFSQSELNTDGTASEGPIIIIIPIIIFIIIAAITMINVEAGKEARRSGKVKKVRWFHRLLRRRWVLALTFGSSLCDHRNQCNLVFYGCVPVKQSTLCTSSLNVNLKIFGECWGFSPRP